MSLFIVLIFIFIVAVVFFIVLNFYQRRLRLPSGEHIYSDTSEKPGELLFYDEIGLMGKPDYIIQQKNQTIPVEVKTGRTPSKPYPGHIMQLIAYCILVENTYGVRPPYGIIRYNEQNFQIQFTPEYETLLKKTLEDMKQKIAQENLHRSHNNPYICNACGFKSICDERLSL